MFMTNLSILARYSRTYCERQLVDRNIGFTEQSILLYLCNEDKVNQYTIAAHFMLDKGAIAKTLSKLEEKNYIVRTDNPNNKREKLVTITEQGRSNILFFMEQMKELHDFLFEGLSEEELAQFTETFKKITQNAIKAIQGRTEHDETT